MTRKRSHRTHHRRRRNPLGAVRVLAGRAGLAKALTGLGRAARVVVVR